MRARTRVKILVPAAFAAAAATTCAPALTAVAVADSGPVVVADHLDNPRQMDIGPDGTLWVAEAGAGADGADHPGACGTGPEGDEVCTGDTGAVTVVPDAATASGPSGSRVLDHLLSVAAAGDSQTPPGTAAVGIDDVSLLQRGAAYGIFTWIEPDLLAGLPPEVAGQNGILGVRAPSGRLRQVADIAAYSLARPRPGHEPDSDPYGVLAAYGHVYVADAANNTLLEVTRGHIRTLHAFPYRHGDGSDGSYDTVPTSVATDGHGLLYVGALGSFIPGAGRVFVLDRRGHVVRVVRGLSQVNSVAVDRQGTIWATEIFGGEAGPFGDNGPNGLLVRIARDGTRTTTPVPLPGGVTVDPNGHVFVSVFSILAGAGQVWRLS